MIVDNFLEFKLKAGQINGVASQAVIAACLPGMVIQKVEIGSVWIEDKGVLYIIAKDQLHYFCIPVVFQGDQTRQFEDMDGAVGLIRFFVSQNHTLILLP